MNVYVQIEIKVRELEGRMLLALAAAERGHHVLVGDLRRYLENGVAAFPPGVFHDKSLEPTTRKLRLHRRLVERGFVVTSQDEEHWLALPTFDVPARKRFSDETLANVARSFAWGDHEAEALRTRYPQHAGRIVVTGSPRVDLWRPDADHRPSPAGLPAALSGRDVVLFSSNFSAVLDVNPFWVRVADKRQLYDGTEDPYEFDRYDFTADKHRVLGAFVRAIRRLAQRRPDVTVVVRPHPIEALGAWDDLIGSFPNVLVTREGNLIDWVRRSRVVVQNGCTSGYEAAVAGIPVVSFHPFGIFADHPVNALGRRASDQDELVVAIDAVLATPRAPDAIGPTRSGTHRLPPGGEELLARRIAAREGRLAADRITDEFESAGADLPDRPWSTALVSTARRAVRARARLGRSKDALVAAVGTARSRGADPRFGTEPRGSGFARAHKLPDVTRTELRELVEGLRRAFGRFEGVRVERLGGDLVAIRPAGGRGGPRS